VIECSVEFLLKRTLTQPEFHKIRLTHSSPYQILVLYISQVHFAGATLINTFCRVLAALAASLSVESQTKFERFQDRDILGLPEEWSPQYIPDSWHSRLSLSEFLHPGFPRSRFACRSRRVRHPVEPRIRGRHGEGVFACRRARVRRSDISTQTYARPRQTEVYKKQPARRLTFAVLPFKPNEAYFLQYTHQRIVVSNLSIALSGEFLSRMTAARSAVLFSTSHFCATSVAAKS